MSKKIPKKTKEEISRLYDNNELSLAKIAWQTGVSYSLVYSLTRLRQRVNPETGKKFRSLNQLKNYQARKRQEKPENQVLSDLMQQRLTELNRTQKWLAEQLGITRGSVSRYTSGKITPRNNLQEGLFKALEVPYQTLDNLLEDR